MSDRRCRRFCCLARANARLCSTPDGGGAACMAACTGAVAVAASLASKRRCRSTADCEVSRDCLPKAVVALDKFLLMG